MIIQLKHFGSDKSDKICGVKQVYAVNVNTKTCHSDSTYKPHSLCLIGITLGQAAVPSVSVWLSVILVRSTIRGMDEYISLCFVFESTAVV